MTVLSAAVKPASTWNGVHGLSASASAMQKVNLPAWPCVDMSVSPGMSPPMLRRINCTARPIVALARRPWPNRLPLELMSSCLGDRAVDDRCSGGGGVGRGLDAVELAVGIEQGVDSREHDREIFRPTARHDGVDRELLDCGFAPARWHGPTLSSALAAGRCDHACDLRGGWSDDRKAVGPAAREEQLLVVAGVSCDGLTLLLR